MKLIRVGTRGAEKPGLIDAQGRARDLSGHVIDIDRVLLGGNGLAQLAAIDPDHLPLVPPDTRLGPPVTRPGKFIAIGLNYADHARESNLAQPDEPVVFLKATSSIIGPNDPIEIPRGADKVDWEVELGVVIGRRAKYIPVREQALEHIAGYLCVNDVSERHFQLERGGQWTKGKSHDGFGPLGPWLVTRDEVPDPQALRMWLEVDGRRRQDGMTADMIFPVDEIVRYLSHMMTLEPGDVIATGTPAGVGLGQTPQVYLRPGQRVRLGIDGLGEQDCATEAA
jgi:2-keto-4-pentenoate hydratase/2-oxohepta-3-ene-1,7-dioic acid hydratase in catechol pathway